MTTANRFAGPLLLIAALSGAGRVALARQQTSNTAAVSGVVIDATTKSPVAGAVVTLSRSDGAGPPIPRMVADSRGRFVFKDLPPGNTYYLGASRNDYAYTRYGWSGPNQSLAIKDIFNVSLAAGQWIDNISIPLWKLGSLSGRIVDERGEPLVGVSVRAFSTVAIAGTPQLVGGAIAVTDDRGVYRMTNLEPGKYVVSVLSVQSTVLATTPDATQSRAVGELASGGISSGSGSFVGSPTIDADGKHRIVMTNFPVPPAPGGGQVRVYPATFFPGARTAAQATAIDIAYGSARAGVDIQIRPVPAAKVTGRIEGGPASMPPMLLRMMPGGHERLGFGSETATTTVDRDGTFTFLNVPDGNYTILAQASQMEFMSNSTSTRFADPPGFPGGSAGVGSLDGVPGLNYLNRGGQTALGWGRASVSVGARDVVDVTVTLHPPVRISGRFEAAPGTAPLRPGAILMTFQPANGDTTLGMPRGETDRSDPASPAFTVDGFLGGVYLLYPATFAGGRHVSSILSDGKEVLDTGFDASLGRNIENVRILLTDKTTTIDGVVQSPAGQGAAAVIAFPADRALWANAGWNPRRIKATRADSTGKYQVAGLPEGEYLLIAVDQAQKDAWVDPKFLAAAAPLATRIPLKWGDTKTQDMIIKTVVVK